MANYPTLDGNGNVLIPAPGFPLKEKGLDTLTATTKADATVSIEAAAVGGIDEVRWSPSADTDSTYIIGGRLSKLSMDVSNGNVLAPAHGVGHYTLLHIYGSGGVVEYSFVNEQKLKVGADVTLDYVSFVKPAIDEIAGDVGNLVLFDGDLDTARIATDGGSLAQGYLMYAPRLNLLSKISGGIITEANLLTGNYAFTDNDSGKRFLSFPTGPITVTVKPTPSHNVRVVQGNSHQVTFAAPGGVSIFCVDGAYPGYTKTAAMFASVDVDCYTSTVVILSGKTGA